MADHPTLKLGRRPPDPKRPALHLSHYLTGVIPDHPVVSDHFGRLSDWGLYGNDHAGVCGPVYVANDLKLVSLYIGDVEVSVTQEDVYDLYRRSGNPNFDPATGADDNGVEMSTMLSALLKGGIGGHKPIAFAKVDVTNLDEVRAAIAIFGSLGFGVDLQQAQQGQTDSRLWDYQPSGVWGGHAILAGLYTSQPGNDISVVTWAKVVGTTDAFCAHQLQEGWVLIWPEHLGSKAFLQGVDLAALAKDYKDLTGRDFPAPIPPSPPPPPIPVPPNPKPPTPPPPPAPSPNPAAWKKLEALAQELLKEIRAILSGH